MEAEAGAAATTSGAPPMRQRNAASVARTVASAAALVQPDETLLDVLQAAHASRGGVGVVMRIVIHGARRGSGVECLDAQLQSGSLGPGELVVLSGAAGAGKSGLLRHVLASHIAPVEWGGHGVRAVLIDADQTFGLRAVAGLLDAWRAAASEAEAAAPADMAREPPSRHLVDSARPLWKAQQRPTEPRLEEALSRLLVLRPKEPIDLLRLLWRMRSIFSKRPGVALLAVDSMSAWQPLATAFPKAVPPVIQESWRALSRLQEEFCVAVVVTDRGTSATSTRPPLGGAARQRCRYLRLARSTTVQPPDLVGPVESFELSALERGGSGGAAEAVWAAPTTARSHFSFSRDGAVVEVAAARATTEKAMGVLCAA